MSVNYCQHKNVTAMHLKALRSDQKLQPTPSRHGHPCPGPCLTPGPPPASQLCTPAEPTQPPAPAPHLRVDTQCKCSKKRIQPHKGLMNDRGHVWGAAHRHGVCEGHLRHFANPTRGSPREDPASSVQQHHGSLLLPPPLLHPILLLAPSPTHALCTFLHCRGQQPAVGRWGRPVLRLVAHSRVAVVLQQQWIRRALPGVNVTEQ